MMSRKYTITGTCRKRNRQERDCHGENSKNSGEEKYIISFLPSVRSRIFFDCVALYLDLYFNRRRIIGIFLFSGDHLRDGVNFVQGHCKVAGRTENKSGRCPCGSACGIICNQYRIFTGCDPFLKGLDKKPASHWSCWFFVLGSIKGSKGGIP